MAYGKISWKFLTTAFCSLLYLSVHAQVINPVAGKKIYFQTVTDPRIKTVPAKGKVDFWDFGYLQSGLVFYYDVYVPAIKTAVIYNKANLALKDNFGNISYFIQGKNKFNEAGYSGQDPFGLGRNSSFTYDPVLMQNYGNLGQGSSRNFTTYMELMYETSQLNEDVINQFPVVPDSFQLQVELNRSVFVDGSGEMYLGGSHLKVVKRVTETEDYNYKYLLKNKGANWIDVTPFLNGKLDLPLHSKRVFFFEPGSTLPVLSLDINDELNQVKSAQYFITRKSAAKKTVVEGVPKMSIYPNPAFTSKINLEMINIPAGRYQLKIYSLIGTLELEKAYYINNYKNDKLDISSLKPGVYIYALQDSSGKVIFSKRLTVVSP